MLSYNPLDPIILSFSSVGFHEFGLMFAMGLHPFPSVADEASLMKTGLAIKL